MVRLHFYSTNFMICTIYYFHFYTQNKVTTGLARKLLNVTLPAPVTLQHATDRSLKKRSRVYC